MGEAGKMSPLNLLIFDGDITSIVFENFDARILENGKVFNVCLVLICRAINFSGIVRGNFSKSASSESILMRPSYRKFFKILIWEKKGFSGRNWAWDAKALLTSSS